METQTPMEQPQNGNGKKNWFILIAVAIVAVFALWYWFAGVNDLNSVPQPVGLRVMPAATQEVDVQKSLDAVDTGSIEKDFQAIDADIQKL